MGTPAFAVPALERLTEIYEVVAVFTQPDRPSGRGKKLKMSPVKLLAQEKGIPVYQPEKIRRESVETLRELQPDLCVTAAFGQILSQEILDIPRMGTVNVHASLLPRHRGAAPIAWAIWQGDSRIGVTTMMTEKGIDNGDMLLSRAFDRDPALTCGEWTERLSVEGADLLMETLARMENGTCPRTVQDEAEMTYDPMLKKEMGDLSFDETAHSVRDWIHALNPWPCCSVPYADGRMKLLRAEVTEGSGLPGTVLKASAQDGLVIACREGAVRLVEIQQSGGKAMRDVDYLRGHRIEVGQRFGQE